MPYLIIGGVSFLIGTYGGATVSGDLKKALIYAGVGFAAYQLVVK